MTGTLKQYAIDRVLANADSELYRYVAAGDAIPVAVLGIGIQTPVRIIATLRRRHSNRIINRS